MADNTKLDVVLSIVDAYSKGLDDFNSKLKTQEKTFSGIQKAGAASFAAITGVVAASTLAYGEAERSQRQLEHAVIDVSHGTEAQVKAISDASDALQKKSGIDGDALKMGAAQLSTFGLQSESVVNLTKSLADLTVNQDGVNASSDSYVASANTIAKALNGQFGVLEKSGIRFTEAQQKIIKYGTETEKVAALQEGFAQNLRETTDTLDGIDAANAKAARSFGEIFETVGKGLAPAIEKLSAFLVPVLESMNQWASENEELVPVIIGAGLAISALLVAVGSLGLVLPVIITGFTALAAVFTFIALNPIILFIAALIAIGVLLYQNWDTVAKFGMDIWNAILTFFGGVVQSISNYFTEMWNTSTNTMNNIYSFLQGIWDTIGQVFTYALALIVGAVYLYFDAIGINITEVFMGISQFFTDIWLTITTTFMSAITAIQLGITAATTAIRTTWESIWSAISSFFSTIWSGMSGTVGGAMQSIISYIAEATQPIQDAFSAMWIGITGVFSGAIEGLQGMVKGVLNWIVDKINTVIGALNSVAGAASKLVPGIKAPKIGTIPALAEGGIVTKPTLAMIGEGGQSEAVIPLSKLGKMGGGGITINVTGNSFTDRASFEQLINDVLIKQLRKNLMPS